MNAPTHAVARKPFATARTFYAAARTPYAAAPTPSATARSRLGLPLLGAVLVPGAALALAGAFWPATGAAAVQQTDQVIPGVELGLVYETTYVPPIAVLPFRAVQGRARQAEVAHGIVAGDLRFSDRFQVVDSLPSLSGEGVDYGLWDGLGADWVLTGVIERATGGGSVLEIELHDIVFASLRERARFSLPPTGDPDYRLAVHRASDAVVTWVTDEPGIAASRIVFAMRPWGDPAGSSKEMYVVDSDGENLQRLTWDESIVVSPTWSPTGDRIAYTSYRSGFPRIYERGTASDTDRLLETGQEGQQITPAYHPDGRTITFAVLNGRRSDLHSYDVGRRCCLSERLSEGYYKNLQPTYSQDGDRIAFTSNRLGTPTPQVYVMPADGGDADLISPYRYGERSYFTDPDWSPLSSKVAFAGRVDTGRTRVGGIMRYQILVADLDAGTNRLVQLTREGNNEDPSWAPNGRHIVFTGERRTGHGVFVVDTGTGRTRTLVAGVKAEDVDWSPLLPQTR